MGYRIPFFIACGLALFASMVACIDETVLREQKAKEPPYPLLAGGLCSEYYPNYGRWAVWPQRQGICYSSDAPAIITRPGATPK